MSTVAENRPDVYARKGIASRKRNARIDARLAAEFAQRRLELKAKLDAIVAEKKAAAAELEDLIEGREDEAYWRSGCW